MPTRLEAHDFTHYDPALWPADPQADEGLKIFLASREAHFDEPSDIPLHLQEPSFIAYDVINQLIELTRPSEIGESILRYYSHEFEKPPEDMKELFRHTLFWAMHHLNWDSRWVFSNRQMDELRAFTADLASSGLSPL